MGDLKVGILAILNSHTREMEGYSYFGSNPGIDDDDYEDVADDIIRLLQGAGDGADTES